MDITAIHVAVPVLVSPTLPVRDLPATIADARARRMGALRKIHHISIFGTNSQLGSVHDFFIRGGRILKLVHVDKGARGHCEAQGKDGNERNKLVHALRMGVEAE